MTTTNEDTIYSITDALGEKIPKTWHVDSGQGPYSFCGEIPGPDERTWHAAGTSASELLELALRGAHICPICLLTAAKAIELSVRGDDDD